VGLTCACTVILIVGVVGAMMMGWESAEPKTKSRDSQEQPTRQDPTPQQATSDLDNATPLTAMMYL
jgi:hypothetical protein